MKNRKHVEMKRTKTKAVTVSFRCPAEIFAAATARAASEDTDFSKIVRRALRRELAAA